MGASVLLYWHWEAMLISYLATRVIVLPFNNIDELVKTSSFKIALNPGSSYEDAFKFATEPSWQVRFLYNRLAQITHPDSHLSIMTLTNLEFNESYIS